MRVPSIIQHFSNYLLIFHNLLRLCQGTYMELWTQVYGHPPYSSNSYILCDSLGLPLKPDVILPETQNASCQDMHDFWKDNPPFPSSLYDTITHRCCDTSLSTTKPYECSKNIRSKILDDADRFVPPKIDYDKVLVEFRISFESLHDVNIKESTVSSFFGVGLKWRDPRLAWNISGDFCQAQIKVKASENPETTEIWVPDFDLINRNAGIREFNEANAFVNSDGTVTWLRSGMLEAFCSFQGMAQIPFDKLGCQMIFGSKDFETYEFVSPVPFEKGLFQSKYKTFNVLINEVT